MFLRPQPTLCINPLTPCFGHLPQNIGFPGVAGDIRDADLIPGSGTCPTLCDPTDGSPIGSLVPGILQARILEWVAISFSNAWKWKVKVKSLSRVRLLATPWTAAHQAPPSMGFSRQENWSGVPLPSPTRKGRFYQISLFSNLPGSCRPSPPV